MNLRTLVTTATLAFTLSTSAGLAVAQDHKDQGDHKDQDHRDPHPNYVRHDEWKKGAKMNQNDWKRGQAVDYHQYHLNAPPRGYEWRSVDGNYVLAAVATGLIASVIVASSVH